ncbi:MAG: aminoacyl-tRNA hydrolase [Candidatus Velthaea sp.]
MIVGLGNPGRRYARTRHNAGFMVVDELARRWGRDADWKTRGDVRELVDRPRGAVLLEPLSYMNLSGEPAQRVAAWYKIVPEDILAVVDDLDLPFGKLRMRARGSSGGHNGLKSLIAVFGQEFPRLRVGIGRDRSGDAIDRVLTAFDSSEEERLTHVIDAAVRGIELWRERDIVTAVNFVNAWTPVL